MIFTRKYFLGELLGAFGVLVQSAQNGALFCKQKDRHIGDMHLPKKISNEKTSQASLKRFKLFGKQFSRKFGLAINLSLSLKTVNFLNYKVSSGDGLIPLLPKCAGYNIHKKIKFLANLQNLQFGRGSMRTNGYYWIFILDHPSKRNGSEKYVLKSTLSVSETID